MRCASIAVYVLVALALLTIETVTASADENIFAGRSIKLAEGRTPTATIVHGIGLKHAAVTLQAHLVGATSITFPIAVDQQVVQADRFDYQDPWQKKTVILVGNVENNRAFLKLYSRYLVGVNNAYPGAGLYVLRTLSDPLFAGADVVVVGGSDEAGLQAAMARFIALVSSSTDDQGNCMLRPLVEIGDATERISLDLGRAKDNFVGQSYKFFWTGDASAGRKAKRHLLAEVEKGADGLWEFEHGGHYHWEEHYRQLFQVLASGVLSHEQTATLDDRLYHVFTATEDSVGRSAVNATLNSSTKV